MNVNTNTNINNMNQDSYRKNQKCKVTAFRIDVKALK